MNCEQNKAFLVRIPHRLHLSLNEIQLELHQCERRIVSKRELIERALSAYIALAPWRQP